MSDKSLYGDRKECMPRAIRERGAHELYAVKRQVEDYFGPFWVDNPHLNIDSPEFDVLAYVAKLREIEKEAGLETGGISISFKNVTVEVPIDITTEVRTVEKSAIQPFLVFWNAFATLFRLKAKPKSEKHKLLDDVSGFVESGETCLILGPPGSGASTLMSVLSQRADVFKSRSGEVLYNKMNVEGKETQQMLRHLIRVVGQEDVHFPSLTVSDTLEFASHCLYPPFLPYAEYSRSVKVINVARGLGIERVLSTCVGDASIRGVSGGEKKRVTLAEMLVGYTGRLYFLDSFNKGLDSAATFDIVLNMKKFSKLQEIVVIATLQQPSREVFEMFDKLLVLDSGKTLFFGKPSEARAYFESLGFEKPHVRSVPDFVSTVSDPKEFDSMVKEDCKDTAPRTVDEFAARFKESEHYRAMDERLAEGITGSAELFQEGFEKTEDFSSEKAKLLTRKSLNRRSTQLKLLFDRQFRLEAKKYRMILVEFIMFGMIGLILGTLFLNLPLTQEGAYSRQGLIFLCLIFNGLSAMSTIGKKYAARAVFEKQSLACFYTPGPFVVASTAVDVLIMLVKVIVFSVCVYFLAGLQSQRFGVFILILWIIGIVVDALIRVLTITFEQNATTGLAGAMIVLLVIYAGFLIPKGSVPGWFIWVYWISPFRYAFEALMINEFYGLEFFCKTSELIPSDPSIPPEFKTCPITNGQNYITEVLQMFSGTQWVWYDFAVLIAMLTVFLAIASIQMILFKPKSFGFKKLKDTSNEEEDLEEVSLKVNDAKMENSEQTRDVLSFGYETSKKTEVHPGYIVWKNLSYTVPVGKGQKQLLTNINGFCRPGRLIALMGSSGAGKTTLMDTVARRKTKGTITGDIMVNGEPQDEFFSRISGYVEQMDLHYEKLTVRESLEFSARLRLPQEVPEAEKQAVVERTLDTLLLRPIQDRIVGSPGSYGLAAEARKRLTIGVELVSNPSILFLDEPTSGLEARAAITVIRAIRNVANLGCAVICTIHQPSVEIFNAFDELLLLQRGGQTVYFGELGKYSRTLLDYFERNGAPPMEEDKNPAEYMLVQIGAGVTAKSDDDKNWHEIWKASPEAKKIADVVESGSFSDGIKLVPEKVGTLKFDSRYATSGSKQLNLVIRRAFVMAWRTPEYNFTRFLLAIFQSVIFGLSFLQLDRDAAGSQLIPSVLFLSGLSGSMQMTNVIAPLFKARPVFYRELSSGLYSEWAYHLSNGIVEIPFVLASGIIFQVIFYFMIGFTASRFGFFVLANYMFTFWAIYTGHAIVAFIGDITVALSVPPLINTLGNVLAGFLIRKPAIPPWYIWIYWINPFHYYNEGILVNELQNQPFYCTPDQFIPFQNPNPSQPCSSLDNGSYEYFAGPNPALCETCRITNGNQILAINDIG